MNQTITLTKANFATVFWKLYNRFLQWREEEYIISPIIKKKDIYTNSDVYINQERIVYDNINDLISDLHKLRKKKWK